MLQRQIAAMIDRLTQHLDSAVYAGPDQADRALESLVNRWRAFMSRGVEHPRVGPQAAFERILSNRSIARGERS
jgi:hypothetical protein